MNYYRSQEDSLEYGETQLEQSPENPMDGSLLSFDEYWRDPRFSEKRPNLGGSLKRAFGDNIYHRRGRTREWIQENSHHSLPDGRANPINVQRDTNPPRVLISFKYTYLGGEGPRIPRRFRRAPDVCVVSQGHKCRLPEPFVVSFVEWLLSLGMQGFAGRPKEFRN